MKRNKKLKYFLNTSVVVAGAVIITILLNAVLLAFDSKIPLEINLTRDDIYQLTEETCSIVDEIKTDTDIVILYDGELTQDMMLLCDIVELYTKRNENIHLKMVDFVNNPTDLAPYAAAIKGISNPYYAMLFVQGERFETAEASTYISNEGYSNIERIITNKLATFVDGYQISSVLMTEGHGEKTSSGFEAVLAMYNYQVDSINLLTEELPQNERLLLIVNAPVGDFASEEIEKLDAFLDRGGNVQIYFDPMESNEELPRLESYLKNEWAITRNHGVVVDMDNWLDAVSEATAKYGILSIAELTDHAIVAPIKTGKRNVLYSASNHFEIAGDKPSAIEISPVLKTTEHAYCKDIATLGEPKQSGDASGSFDILLTATRQNYTINDEVFYGKLLVSGSGYTMNTLIGDTRFANEDLLLNSINWMRGSEAGVTVRSKELPQGSLTLPNSQFWPWFIVMVVIIPVIICMAGIVVFIKRRYQ